MMIRGVLTYFLTIVLLLVGCGANEPQPTTVHPTRVRVTLDSMDSVMLKMYDFVNLEADTIIDPRGTLRVFYERLHLIDTLADDAPMERVSILHFGDSHVQAGVFPNVVMRRLARRFGTAGRGLITPHRISRSNESRDYAIVSPNLWHTSRLIDSKAEVAVGVTGVGLKSNNISQIFNIKVLSPPGDTLDYSFNRVVVFHDSLAPMITVREGLLADISGSDFEYDFVSEIDLVRSVDSLELFTYNLGKFRDGAFYGFSLENGRSGTMYHYSGVNGACYMHWGRRDEIARQSVALQAELIIVSLGSNEAGGRNLIESVLYAQIDSFVGRIREQNPGVAILLTTPFEAMRYVRGSGSRPNTNFEKIQRTILRYGQENGVAVLDLYEVTGGKDSSREWKKAGLLQRDGIHYTPDGYTLQGLLLYNALMQGYVKCVQ